MPIDDLESRGLLSRTLVLFLTEFGRTPKINKDGGRDHWGTTGSIFFAGGGVNGGQVIGATDARGAHPTTPQYGPWDVAATVYEALGIDRQLVLTDREGRRIPLLPEGQPIGWCEARGGRVVAGSIPFDATSRPSRYYSPCTLGPHLSERSAPL